MSGIVLCGEEAGRERRGGSRGSGGVGREARREEEVVAGEGRQRQKRKKAWREENLW